MVQDRADAATVEAFLAGGQDAAKEVEHLIGAAFRRWSRRFGHETDDILSDIWYKLLTSFQRGDFEFRSSLSTYIRQIVDHTCIDYLRFRQRVNVVDVDTVELHDPQSNAEDILARRQDAHLAFRVLRLMSKECRQLWRMQLQQGLTCRQIGEFLGKTEGNIRRRLWACRESAKKIRQKILKGGKRFGRPNANESERGG